MPRRFAKFQAALPSLCDEEENPFTTALTLLHERITEEQEQVRLDSVLVLCPDSTASEILRMLEVHPELSGHEIAALLNGNTLSS